MGSFTPATVMPTKTSPSSVACFDCATPDYETGLCDCWVKDNAANCEPNCEICCYASNMWVCLAAANAEKALGEKCVVVGKSMAMPAVIVIVVFNILGTIFAMAAPPGVSVDWNGTGRLIGQIIFAVMAAGWRAKLQAKWGYTDPGFMKNCMCIFFCGPCAIAQDAIEIKNK